MSKIVVLNSGGFDSVVLVNDIYNSVDEDTEIHSLHFSYGEINKKKQIKCVDKVCKKLNLVNIKLGIPKLNWSSNKFYDKNSCEFNSQYLEYRNLIFLSYAVSYAQSIGAKEIYMAVLKSHGYCDTNHEFIDGLNKSIEQSGITIITPYAELEKEDLFCMAKFYGITSKDFISCDLNNCGVCGDCIATKNYVDFMSINTPIKAFNLAKTTEDTKFKELFRSNPVKEVRLLINNSCQLKCSHCFYGFEDMIGEPLTEKEMCNVIREAIKIGVTHFHFSGKEPMINEQIFKYAEYIRSISTGVTFDVVTNGITVPKYADELNRLGFSRVCLSVDDIDNTNGVRAISNVTDKALKALKTPVEVFIDLHENNWNRMNDIIYHLYNTYEVHNFFVRTIRNIGNANVHLKKSQIDKVYCDLLHICENNEDIKITFNVGAEYVSKLLNEDYEISHELRLTQEFNSAYILNNFIMLPQFYCGRYESQITITPDGYVLGCGSEVSYSSYDKLSAGNVRDKNLLDLIQIGKEKSLCTQSDKCVNDGHYLLTKCPYYL